MHTATMDSGSCACRWSADGLCGIGKGDLSASIDWPNL